MSFISANIAGPDGLIVVLVIAIVLFGSTQIPKIARSLGSAQKEFKKGLDEGATEDPAAAPASLPEPAPQAAVPAPAPAPAPAHPQSSNTPDSAS
jgi:sec-independent protein translocase protein TatA